MIFRDILGLPISYIEQELVFNRELIYAKKTKSYSTTDLALRGDKGDDREHGLVYKQYPDVYLVQDKVFWEDIVFDIFMIYTGFQGEEFNQIPGHYTSIAPNGFHYPELYQIIEGYAEFVLQQPNESHERVKDAILYRANSRDIIIVPPTHGVTIINPSDKNTIIARIRGREAEDVRKPFTDTHGACYYREKNNKWSYNTNYQEIPTLRLLPTPDKWKIFHRGLSIYQTIVNNPGISKRFIEPIASDFITY